MAAKIQAKKGKGFSDNNQSWLKLMNAHKMSSGEEEEEDDDEEPMVCKNFCVTLPWALLLGYFSCYMSLDIPRCSLEASRHCVKGQLALEFFLF